jgi:hypothetical protein
MNGNTYPCQRCCQHNHYHINQFYGEIRRTKINLPKKKRNKVSNYRPLLCQVKGGRH